MAGLAVRGCPGCGGSLGVIGQTLGAAGRSSSALKLSPGDGWLHQAFRKALFGAFSGQAQRAEGWFHEVGPERRGPVGRAGRIVAGAGTANAEDAVRWKDEDKVPKRADARKLLHGKKVSNISSTL